MPLFTPKREFGVQSFILKVVNNACPGLEALIEGPRSEGRVQLVLVVMVIPVENRQLCVDEAFTAITKEFSTKGLAIVLNQPVGLEEVILGFRSESGMTFVRAKAKHLNPMGGGFFQLGLQMTEIVSPGDYPQLQEMRL
ncbi:MAG: hypothetical protein JXB62_22585 [Pirellulales bacterium]|nr:hypothetical protein [Pirellulales bacterium]